MFKSFFLYIFFSTLILFSNVCKGQESSYIETEMRSLALELRCLVCQNQTILESDSHLAIDIKSIIKEKLALGLSKLEIKEYLYDRYGDFILFKPRFNYMNLILWLSPLLFLLLIAFLAFKSLKINKNN